MHNTSPYQNRSAKKHRRLWFAHTKHIHVYRLYLLEVKQGAARCICHGLILDSEDMQLSNGLFQFADIFIQKSP